MSDVPANDLSPTSSHAIRAFWLHAAAFAIVNAALTIVNLRKTPSYFWEKWVLLDWGVGLATHAWIVFRSHQSRV